MLYQNKMATALVMTTLLLVSGCSESVGEEPKPINLITVDSRNIEKSDGYVVPREYVGVVQAAQRANLGFELAGKVLSINVDVGDQVKQGDILVTLDTQLLDAERNELLAQLEEIRSQAKLTDSNLKRQYSLQKKGFSSESEIDALTSEKESLAANALRVKSALEANSLKLEKSILKAPYAGVVSKRFVSIGDVVSTGTATLSLLSSDNKEALIGINRKDIKKFSQLKNVSITVNDKPYAATLLSHPSNVDSNSRSVGLRFLLQDSGAVLDGELAYLTFEKSYTDSGFWIPATALTDGVRGTWNVYTLGSEQGQKIIERRVVNVLFASNDSVYVQGSLRGGDEIVTSGLHKVVPGQPVQTAE
ncbi:efflux RND transporter periplasmic adaptor subunit [Vibrio coralliilyticus]|uniref:efflux RND transporter periplasmic adaptor subunit n=1 Tax=Vibrio coralliilyticus TaxID=190893 RepID=UPI000C16B18F|nr:efflux RND transporter periplasmic adaptor subunit [Vibrio coralliilyticus]